MVVDVGLGWGELYAINKPKNKVKNLDFDDE